MKLNEMKLKIFFYLLAISALSIAIGMFISDNNFSRSLIYACIINLLLEPALIIEGKIVKQLKKQIFKIVS